MHLILTDILACPRCGPEFGLILLADRMEDRQVVEGGLGCANCRTTYRIRDGVAELRLSPMAEPGPLAGSDAERAYRVAALSGIADREGTVLVVGAAPAMVGEIGRLLPNARVLGIAPGAPAGAGGVEWVTAEGRFPFRDRTLSAVAVLGAGVLPAAAELGRVLLPGGRLVLDGTGVEAAAFLPAPGWSLLLEQEGVAVASRSPAG